MAILQKAISANPVKNGSARIRLNPGVVHADSFVDLTDNAAIIDGSFDINMFDSRFDDPRYYQGDTTA